MSVWSKVSQGVKSSASKVSNKFNNTRVGKAINERKARKTAENDAKIKKLLNSKIGKFNVGLTGFGDLGSIRKYKRDHKGKLSKFELAKLELAKKAIKKRRINTAKVIGFAVPLLKVMHSLMTISKGDPKNNPTYSTAKATVDANSNIELEKASADKDIYRSLQQKSPMQEYNNTLVKVYSRSKLDSTDKKLDAVIERLDDLAKIENDTRKNSLAQLELSQKEFAAKANRSDQLLTSIKKIQANSTKSIETSQNKSSGLLKKVAIGGGLLALALGPLRSFINKYKLFKEEVSKEETESKLGLVDRIVDSVKQIGQSIANVFTNKADEPKSDAHTEPTQIVSNGSSPDDSDRDSIRKELESKANTIIESGDLKNQSTNIHDQIQAIIDNGKLTKESATEAISNAFKNLSDKEKRIYTGAKFGVTADRMLDTEDQKSMLIAQLSVLDELRKMNAMQAEQLAIAKDESSDSDDSANEDAKNEKVDKVTTDELVEILKKSQEESITKALDKEGKELDNLEIKDPDGKPVKVKKGKGLFSKLSKIFLSGWKGVALKLGTLFFGIKIIQGLVGGISNLWERFKNWFGDTPFGQQVIKLGTSVGESISKLWDNIKDGLSKTEFGRSILSALDKTKEALSNIYDIVKKVSNFLQDRSGAGNDKTKAIAAKTGMGGLKGDYTKDELRKIRKAAGDDGKLSESDFKNLSKELQARIKNQGDYDYLTSVNNITKKGDDVYIIGDKNHKITDGRKDVNDKTISELSSIISSGDNNLYSSNKDGILQLTSEGFNRLSSESKVDLAKKIMNDSDKDNYVPAVPYNVLEDWSKSDEAGAEFKSALEKRQAKARKTGTAIGAGLGTALGVGGVVAGTSALIASGKLGAAIGTFAGPIGTIIGGALGLAAGGLIGYFGTKWTQGDGDVRAEKFEKELQNLPKYAKGTGGHPGGLAVVGDGGEHELIVTPEGDTKISPDKPTLVDLPAGSKVIPEHKLVPRYAEGTPTTDYTSFIPGLQTSSSFFQYNPTESFVPYVLAPEVREKIKESEVNVGKHFDYDKAVKTLKDNSTKVFQSTPTAKRKGYKVGKEKPSNQSYGLCAGHVRRAIEAGGVGMLARPGSAYQYSSFLPKVGFKEIDLDEPKKPGDILVEGKTDKHPHGHISMWDGSKWVSDFVQSRSDGKVHVDGIHGKFSRFRIPEGDVIKPYQFSPEDQIDPIEVDHNTSESTSLADAFDFRKMGEAFGDMINSFTKPSTELGGDIDIKPVQSKSVNLEMSKDDSEDNTESTKSQSPTILQPITNNNNQRGGDTINNITVNNNYTVDSALGSELRG